MHAAISRRARRRWASLHGRAQGGPDGRRPIVLLHGLSFDHRMWEPVLDALAPGQHAIAFDLPGHGGSPSAPEAGLAPVVAAVHDAVLAGGLDRPVVAGHSIGAAVAAIYGAAHPVSGVVSVDAPIRLERFAPAVTSLRDRFGETWAGLRASWHLERLPAAFRALLRPGERPVDEQLRRLVLDYQADLLDRPLEDVVRWRDDGLARLREAGTPYVSLHAAEVDPADRAWLAERLPQAEIAVWPAGHHFPHLSQPARFARLLDSLAADHA